MNKAQARRWIIAIAVVGTIIGIVYGTMSDSRTSNPGSRDDTSSQRNASLPIPISGTAHCMERLPITARVDCLKHVFQKAVREHGTTTTLHAVKAATTQDPDLMHHCHAITHAIGRTTYTITNDISQAFVHCNAHCASGCYHGVMEQFLANTHDFKTSIPTLCQKGMRAEDRYTNFQCLHGLGHGFMIHLKHELMVALEHCDELKTDTARNACYGGVFMENIVSHEHRPSQYLQEDNLHYPCTVVSDRHKAACYFGITDWFVKQNGFNFRHAFTECDRVPETYRFHCLRSMGRSINWHTDHNLKRIIALCALGASMRPPDGWPVSVPGICLMGAVLDLVNVDMALDRASELCAMAESDDKRACYAQLGEALTAIIPDPHQQTAACRRVVDDTQHVPICVAAARGRSSSL